ncbi:MAG: glycosyltransferase family 39 protein [Phycisphaerae bacterium]
MGLTTHPTGLSEPGINRWRPFIIVALAAILRLPGLDRVPPLLNQDEASRGYDAWCLLETGADRHGERLPFFLESFGPGDNTAALSTYLTLPFVACLGPTPTALRLPAALLAVATVLLLYLWFRRWIGEPSALIAAAALAIDPWHIALTRTAHESGFTPFFLVFAMLAMHRADLLPGGSIHPRSFPRAWAFAAGLLFALHAWAYPATRLFTPLFCLAIGIISLSVYIKKTRSRPGSGTILAIVAGLIIGAAPLWLTALHHPGRLASRARATLLIQPDRHVPDMLREFATHYAANLDPRYAFLQADEMSGASIPHVGLHLILLAPLWLIGLMRILTTLRRDPVSRLLFAWLLLYPIPAAICSDWNPHPLRSVAGILLFPIITAIGGQWLIDRFARRSQKTRRSLAVASGLALMLNLAHFADAYYLRFPPFAEDAYQTNLIRAIEFAAACKEGVDFILVTNEANQPYIYALLAEPITPGALALSRPLVTDGPRGFHQVLRAGRFLFVPIDPVGHPDARLLFQTLIDGLPPSGNGLVIERDRPDVTEPESPGVLYRTSAGTSTGNQPPFRHYRVRLWNPVSGAPG